MSTNEVMKMVTDEMKRNGATDNQIAQMEIRWDTMKAYEIEYKINGKQYTIVEQPIKGWESQFLQSVLNRIESLVTAGAVVTALTEIR